MKIDNFNIINKIRATSNISLFIQLNLRQSSLDFTWFCVFFQCYRFISMELGQKIGYHHDINIEVNTPKKNFVATVHNAQKIYV